MVERTAVETLGGDGVGCGGAWTRVEGYWGRGVGTVVSGETRSTRWCKENGWLENFPASLAGNC